MSSSLRDEVADEISDVHDYRARDEMLEAADRILALPRLKKALAMLNKAEWQRKTVEAERESDVRTIPSISTHSDDQD
jgi:hypothetical protein